MKTMLHLFLSALMTGCLGFTALAQEPAVSLNTTDDKTLLANDTDKSDLEELKEIVTDIKVTLDKLVEELKTRSEAADARVKQIEETIGTGNITTFGGISRQLEELTRTIDDIERTVEDIERNQK